VVRIGVLASGSGTNLEAILAAGIPVAVVVVDRPCRATDVAATHGVPAVSVERNSYGKDFDRVAYTNDVIDALEAHAVDLVVMAGFGTIFEKPMFDAFDGRIVNTHPALLPAFPGWHAVRDALAAGVKVTGVTVHVATLEVDAGPILAQAPVPVLASDDEATLHERIKDVERTLYPETISAILERGSVL
jgi:phosphoribosylglycinamide formyltransferase-1